MYESVQILDAAISRYEMLCTATSILAMLRLHTYMQATLDMPGVFNDNSDVFSGYVQGDRSSQSQ